MPLVTMIVIYRHFILIGAIPPGEKYTMADLRRIEADLKRKSDLLSEVKDIIVCRLETFLYF